MQKKDTTSEQARPRRSRMPQCVYDAASTLDSQLTDWQARYPHNLQFHGDTVDEVLCQEAKAPLRELSSMAFQKELEPEINEHPHNDPYQCRHLVIEAMRLAYGIQDLIDAGKHVSKEDRQLCAELFNAFKTLKKATDAAHERWRARVHSKRPEMQEKKATPQECFTIGAGFDWPYFGVHYLDTLTIREDGQVKVGQLAAIRCEDEDRYYLVRICSIKADAIRIANLTGVNDDIDPAQIVGAVVEVEHEDCNQAKIEALRQRLTELQEDDEHTLSVTKCFEVEKQIFDLEHPLEEIEEDDDEWPEVIGDE